MAEIERVKRDGGLLKDWLTRCAWAALLIALAFLIKRGLAWYDFLIPAFILMWPLLLHAFKGVQPAAPAGRKRPNATTVVAVLAVAGVEALFVGMILSSHWSSGARMGGALAVVALGTWFAVSLFRRS